MRAVSGGQQNKNKLNKWKKKYSGYQHDFEVLVFNRTSVLALVFTLMYERSRGGAAANLL